jgi:2-polyprenyl-3-methyl-5-hydroxy-6-metoxy-1,4-benzoquinol methylase
MSCCTTRGTDRFFSRSAKHYARRFRRRGLDAPQGLLAEGLDGLGVQNATLIEIGCGVGGLHLTLFERGIAFVQAVELSEGMISQARALASERGVEKQVRYLRGDFVDIAGQVDRSDIVVMDKVLCCYADPVQLIQAAALKARSMLAVSYPRQGLLARISFGLAQTVGKVLRWSFHPFYHATDLLENSIGEEGFAEVYSSATVIWQVKIFKKEKRINVRAGEGSSPVFGSARSA